MALSNLLVCELRDEAGLAYPTVSTQKHFEQMVIITVCHLTHWRGEVGGRREEGRGERGGFFIFLFLYFFDVNLKIDGNPSYTARLKKSILSFKCTSNTTSQL